MRKAWFLHFSRSLLVTYMITVRLEKKIIVLERVLILDPKLCTNPVDICPYFFIKCAKCGNFWHFN